MREIKFRALTARSSKWVIGDLAKMMSDECLCIMPNSYFATRDFGEEDENGNPIIQNELAIGGFIPVKKETVGQFTGLTDKNGKEIYEGDIFTMGDENIKYVIEYHDGQFLGRQLNNKSKVGLHYWLNKVEIIGNIQENPELL